MPMRQIESKTNDTVPKNYSPLTSQNCYTHMPYNSNRFQIATTNLTITLLLLKQLTVNGNACATSPLKSEWHHPKQNELLGCLKIVALTWLYNRDRFEITFKYSTILIIWLKLITVKRKAHQTNSDKRQCLCLENTHILDVSESLPSHAFTIWIGRK